MVHLLNGKPDSCKQEALGGGGRGAEGTEEERGFLSCAHVKDLQTMISIKTGTGKWAWNLLDKQRCLTVTALSHLL